MSEPTDTNEDVSGLKNKNADLIRTNKELKERAERAERERDEAADNAASANSTELEKMQKRAEKAEREAKAANERADTNAKTLRDFRADNAINAAIAAANVDSKHILLLAKALRADVEFSDDGEPLIGGKTIDVHAKSFFAKDGLSYVRAANNTGGLATGNDGSDASPLIKKPETADEWNAYMKLSDAERAALDKQHGI